MPTRKQRRRRAKEKRHDYEIVYVDSEGKELDAAEIEQQVPPKERRNGGAKPRQPAARSTRHGQMQPPSWNRSLKRGLIFGPIFLATVWLIGRGHGLTPVGAVVQSLLLLVVFVPFSYLLDSMMWRAFQRRQARSTPSKR
jgi:hypothetical protein